MAPPKAVDPALAFDESLFKHSFLETSSSTILFAKHRIDYLRSVEQFILKACALKKIAYTVDYEACTMAVATTDTTRDPYIIVKATDLIQLLSQGMILEHAMRVLEDDIFGEVVMVRRLCSNEKVFEHRRDRLNNPKVLRAIELLTRCHVLVSGKTACIVGSERGLEEAKRIITACFDNVHPLFEIRRLMAVKNLAQRGVEGSWDRFLPTIKKTHSKHRKPGRVSGGMPAEITPRKEDKLRETGEICADEGSRTAAKLREQRRAREKKRRQLRAAKKEE